MKSLLKLRSLGVLGVIVATQLLSACVVLPVPYRQRAVIVEPGYGPPTHREYHDHDRDPYWRR